MYKLRVATYSRVSTKFETQKTSIENQSDLFDQLLEENKDKWQLYNHYVDYGITGTSEKRRKAFLKMREDAIKKKFDILIAKSLTRFGRNRADTSYTLLKVLFPLGIRVIFIEEKLDSENREDRAKLGLYEWLAEMESNKISDRMQLQISQLREKGLFSTNKPPYGYSIYNHRLEIIDEEAKVVKKIFDLYLSGYGIHRIVDFLNDNHIIPRSASKWSKQGIITILENPNYTGNLYQKRSKVKDPITKEIVKIDKSEWEVSYNTHEAIISEDIFNKVQKEREYRKELTVNNIKYTGINLFSGILKCGRCGELYTRKKVHGKYVYSCSEYERRGKKSGCTREAIDEEVLKKKVNAIILKLLNDGKLLDEIYQSKLHLLSVDNINLKASIHDINEQLKSCEAKLGKLINSYLGDNILQLTEEQFRTHSETIQNTIKSLTIEKNRLTNLSQQRSELDSLYSMFKYELESLKDIDNWTNDRLRVFFPEIVVVDKHNVTVKLGIEMFRDGKHQSL